MSFPFVFDHAVRIQDVANPFLRRFRYVHQNFAKIFDSCRVIFGEVREFASRIKVNVEFFCTLDRFQNSISCISELCGFKSTASQVQERRSDLKHLFRIFCQASHEYRRGKRSELGEFTIHNNGDCSPLGLLRVLFLHLQQLIRGVFLCLSLTMCSFLSPKRDGKGQNGKDGLGPRSPFALAYAERRIKPIAVVNRIRHFTSFVVGGAIVCGGMA